jgi:poly(hydroxyalkanoate) granule-associated protein
MPRKKAATGTDREDWVGRIRESWHDVFLAGLASLARARPSSGKPARSDFDALVAEGRKLEPELRDTLQKTWDEWRERSRSTIHAMPFRTEGRLQGVFEERVAAALESLGVPTRKELDALHAKLDRLLGKPPGAPVARREPSPARPAARKAAATKAAATKAAVPKAAARKTADSRTSARKTGARRKPA